ncbi:MAG: DegT/DnrJ/EryC1/StrS family aminotransferase [Phycisphaerae bacterium]|nr:DegT/DnrJ/EryC1/StrS family aminotransferase [Phycisphaerae bacterium]
MQETQKLALLGGQKTVTSEPGDMFTWPIITQEHEDAVLKVLRAGNMSGMDITKEFEKEYAEAIGMKYSLACNNGTAAIHSAFYGMGIGVGDEVICPSLTYWASIISVYSLGATPVFAEIDPETLCVDPADIERCITPRTKAIVVVHYAAMPADMDAIMAIAKKHGVMVFEDCSHAHGCLYKGKDVGTIGDASGFSLMSGKSFVAGEGGIMFTNNQRIYERALLLGHYARHGEIELEEQKQWIGLPCGGYKYRMHQLSSAFGLVQLRHYPQQMAEIDKAMNYFCDLLEDTPGINPIRPAKGSDITKGGWYFSRAKYDGQALGGLSVKRFSEAVEAEGTICGPGCNKPLHTHVLFSEMDVYGHGKPTRIANLPEGVDISQLVCSLPITERINTEVCGIPWFKHYRPEVIAQHAEAFKKVAANYKDLLEDDPDKTQDIGGYSSFRRS